MHALLIEHKRYIYMYSVEWSLKNDGSRQIFGESQNLASQTRISVSPASKKIIKQVSESCILK